MPNIYVTGLAREEARRFSELASDLFARELNTPRESVYVFQRESTLFRAGIEAELPTIIQISWIRRPRVHFLRAAEGLTRIVREDLGRKGAIQVELQEKWEDATIDGELCASWAAR